MRCDGFSAVWTSARWGRTTALLALAIASGCGARAASSAAPAAAPDQTAAPVAPLDEAGCVDLLVSEPADRSRCEGDARGPCVREISLKQTHASPARHVCFVLVTRETWAPGEGLDEMHISTEGTYILAVLDSAEGAWAVRDEKQYRYWRQEIESEEASITIETVGPDAKAVVVSQERGMGAYSDTDVTFYLVTSEGLTEGLSFSSQVSDRGKKEIGYSIDDETSTAGHHDIVLLVEQESYNDEEEDEYGSGEDESWEERYRWNGTEYVQVEGKFGGD